MANSRLPPDIMPGPYARAPLMTLNAQALGLLQQALQLARHDPQAARRALHQASQAGIADAVVQREVARAALQLDPALSLAAMGRAVGLAPADSALRFQYACLLAHQGQHAASLPHFEATVPGRDDAQGWHLLGITLQKLRRHGRALPALRRAHALAPTHPGILEALAESEFHGGHPDDALPLWQQVLVLKPRDTGVVLRTAESFNRVARHGEALALLQRATTEMPGEGELWMALAQTAEDAGNRDLAREAYRRALALRPGWALAVGGLLGLDRARADAADVALGEQLMARSEVGDADRAVLGYELGKVLDGRGEHAAAMAAWHQANAARRRVAGTPDVPALQQKVRDIIASQTRGRLDRIGKGGSDDPRPLFIVGMPRSGTTLTEQILATHPLGHGCGELPDIALIARRLAEDGHGADLSGIPAETLEDATRRYLRAATRNATADARCLVDKAPLNFFHLGLVALLFPNARVVWCRRDPRDIAVSVYAENFALDERLATDLGDIGHYINMQARLMRHWQAELPLPVMELVYEDLARDPEPVARRLVEFAGLEWDPACLEFHRSERGVQTPSRWQVRQPIYTRSIGRWRNYGDALAPLLAVLEPDSYPAGAPMSSAENAQASTPSA